MISIFQAIILGALQGVTELFPISSLGHSIVLPALWGWQINENADYFLIFLVATHFATALVLLGFFYKDWILIIKGILRSLVNFKIIAVDPYARLGWLLIAATIPAGILGLLFQDKLKDLFTAPIYVSIFLILNGLMLYGAEKLRRRSVSSTVERPEETDVEISKLTYWQSIKVGTAQILALLPGFSRTGASLGGGLVSGLPHEAAARFSFLLATPIILAAAVLKLPELFKAPAALVSASAAGAVAAAFAAYLSVRFLTKYFKNNTLVPFAIYCAALGIVSLTILSLR